MNNSTKRRLSWYELLFWIPMGFALYGFQGWPILSDVQRMTKVQARHFMVRVETLIAPLVTVSAIILIWAGQRQLMFLFVINGVIAVWVVAFLFTRYCIRLDKVTCDPQAYVDPVSWREVLTSLVVMGTAAYAVLIVIAEPADNWIIWLPAGVFGEFLATFGMWYFLPLVHRRAR